MKRDELVKLIEGILKHREGYDDETLAENIVANLEQAESPSEASTIDELNLEPIIKYFRTNAASSRETFPKTNPPGGTNGPLYDKWADRIEALKNGTAGLKLTELMDSYADSEPVDLFETNNKEIMSIVKDQISKDEDARQLALVNQLRYDKYGLAGVMDESEAVVFGTKHGDIIVYPEKTDKSIEREKRRKLHEHYRKEIDNLTDYYMNEIESLQKELDIMDENLIKRDEMIAELEEKIMSFIK